MVKELIRSYTKTKEDGTRVKVNVYRKTNTEEDRYDDYDLRKAKLEGISIKDTHMAHPVELVKPVNKIIRGV